MKVGDVVVLEQDGPGGDSEEGKGCTLPLKISDCKWVCVEPRLIVTCEEWMASDLLRASTICDGLSRVIALPSRQYFCNFLEAHMKAAGVRFQRYQGNGPVTYHLFRFMGLQRFSDHFRGLETRK